MKLKWNKVNDTYIEAYLGKWQIISLIKEHDVWKWYNELPFITAKYTGRKFGHTTTAKKAATQATKETQRWLQAAGLTQSVN